MRCKIKTRNKFVKFGERLLTVMTDDVRGNGNEEWKGDVEIQLNGEEIQ